MKNFLKRISVFSITFSLVLVAVTLALFAYVNHKASFKLDSKIKYVVFGHSHPECAINDSLVTSVKNYASSSENFFYTFTKIERLLAQNPSVDTILVAFSNNHLSKNSDETIDDDNALLNKFAPLAPVAGFEHHRYLFAHNSAGYLQAISLSYRSQLRQIALSDFNYLQFGGYKSLDRILPDSIIRNGVKGDLDKYSSKAYASETLERLKQIVAYCKAQNKTIILIRSPQHAKFYGRTNEEDFQHVRMQHFSDLEYLDFNDFPLSDSEFSDLSHLNTKGATKFSIWLNNMIDGGLMQVPNKSEVIESEIAKISL